jgi:predicted transcriptional regulator
MSAGTIALPTRLSRRIEKLAREAGHTPDEMLKFVIRDGLEYCEYAVTTANEGLADLDAGRSVTADEMRAYFEKRRIARRARKAA